MTEPISLGPWSGIDNVHEQHHAVFQPSDEGRARLVAALDVDLSAEGWPTQREEFEQRLAAAGALRVHSGLGLLLLQDSNSIKAIDVSTDPYGATTVVSGLNAVAAEFLTLGDKIFWHNGTYSGTIYEDLSTEVWGLPSADAPVLSGGGGGTLQAGRYMVSVTYVDGKGKEHSTKKASVTTVSSGGTIRVSISPPVGAVLARVWCTKTNGTQLFFVLEAPVGSFPINITNSDVSVLLLKNQHLSPPIAPDCLFSFNGMLMLGVENAVFPSFGLNHHLFDIGRAQEYFPSRVLAGVGLKDGFWTATERGLYWTTGSDPGSWDTDSRDSRKYAKGSLQLAGHLIPFLKVAQPIAVFVSEDGLVFGLPEGQLVIPHQDQLVLDVEGKEASIIWRRQSAGSALKRMAQILFTLV